jgi:hypothetical protein
LIAATLSLRAKQSNLAALGNESAGDGDRDQICRAFQHPVKAPELNRRQLIRATAAAAFLPSVPRIFGRAAAQPVSRVRPGDPAWPSAALWDRLKRDVGGRLIEIRSPFGVCRDDPVGLPCDELFGELKNPYYVGDNPALTQTAGWVDAWTAQPSVFAVAAETAADVAAAVNFARDNNLRLVVKGGGHSYLGTSNAPDSLLVWTRRMNAITPHDSFTPQGCAAVLPAVSVGAGAVWMHVYNVTRLTLRTHELPETHGRRLHSDPRRLGRGLPPSDRAVRRFLRRPSARPALGGHRNPAARQYVDHPNDLPGSGPAAGAGHLATFPRRGGGLLGSRFRVDAADPGHPDPAHLGSRLVEGA